MEEDRGDILKVRIFDEEYSLRGDADREYTERVAGYVDQKMREIAQSFSGRPVGKIAVLAALNITDELFSQRRQQEQLLSELSQRTSMLRENLEKTIG